ncbi:hypothetical protein CO058_01645 [candidate division WWE3 bacterium CG_4_9_14_0_2_um_filter_35_11]|uniref:Uncharacterized protein n=1 Tax=candidate division WWE3 bacterium CG_4_9_14_0_2_um_filter_35_11 TaxID=1975077 RepID=A0A2M8EM18_UNCKA|nr:MAG: hypothetical protein COV25_04000 [candidate division WWE3 bacterium CG10_big_fil_rev_8_21_14_0_10_35_32]PJC23765.1 MAG: hypothetical protein CO058_01645 [candidate division WWE3 bacterium CG_4_9_14_0_2_um_filter_35_11]
MKTLNQNIHPATLLQVGVITETTEGAAVDTYLSGRPAYDSGLIDIAIGDLGDQMKLKCGTRSILYLLSPVTHFFKETPRL